jgi:aspartate 1-decarboxylase
MLVQMLKAKIHRACVTAADLNYEGSITIDENLMDAAGILPNEKVQVLNLSNGTRSETYVIKGKRGSGEIIMNGAIARLVQVGDSVIILAYRLVEEKAAENLKPTIVIVDENNKILQNK